MSASDDFNKLIDRYMENALRYEALLKYIAGMCEDNGKVDWDAKDASEEFKALRNEIVWGLYEADNGRPYWGGESRPEEIAND